MQEKPQTIVECPLTYSLIDETGVEVAKGEGLGRLEEENLVVLPGSFSTVLYFPFRDILDVSANEYKIKLYLTSKEKLTLFDLGYRYEDFLRVLSKLRNEILLKDMLMHETLRKSGVEAEFIYFDEDGTEKQRGKCEPRLYETAVIV